MAHQQYQAQAQQSALQAVHTTARGNLEQFAEHQHQREQVIGQALLETRASLFNLVQELAWSQDARGNAIRAGIEGRLNDILRSVLDETSAMVAGQANDTKLIEMRLLEAISATHSDLTERMSHFRVECTEAATHDVAEQVRGAWCGMEGDVSAQIHSMADVAVKQSVASRDTDGFRGGLTPQQVGALVDQTVLEAEDRIEQKMQSMLQHSQSEHYSKLEADFHRRDSAARRDMAALVRETSASTERQLEQKMQKMLLESTDKLHRKIQKQEQVTTQIREEIQENDIRVKMQFKAVETRLNALEERTISATWIRVCLRDSMLLSDVLLLSN
jgi:hypothetical protein